MSEFEELRRELRGLRGDVETELRGLRSEMEMRFARVDAKLDEKPNAATIYQAALTVFAGMFAAIIGTIVLMKNLGALP